MAVDNIHEKIAAIASKELSGWLKDAEWRVENRAWLKHSQAIALRILRTLRAKNISQKELAEKIGVSPQQVNKIVKGRENLTLETIAKLETALDVVLLTLPPSGEITGDKPSKTANVPQKTAVKKPVAKTLKSV
ncbi:MULTISPECIES: helix-turn-helix domain-containing protein [Chlorobium]|uniref:Helix-turn-helix motif n=1 Tax=Chlorobium ferrooxidans DSM 13031 TaxID=377431 RepID=Q0YSR6_9CHLB|nr:MULTISPECIES: helix-turn-helix transcriptional regulator [Chlorobium]EAT59327.1 Helix-turn-helix motif [Chlorobium ferrooxidans DSM 13031]